MADEPPFVCGDRCRDDGCPFDRAEDAPADCARTVEHRDAVRAFGIEPPFDYPDRCTHPLADQEMICSTCGVLLHDSASAIQPPFILCERHPDCLFQGGCECKRQQIRQRAAHPDQPDTQEGGSDEPRLVQ